MYLKNNDKTGWHIAVVLEVDRTGDSVLLAGVKLIESTWDTDGIINWAKTIKDNSLDYYSEKNWVIVRVKQ
ncbi:MAG: hypothetical protein JXR64_13575 [Spirochaetales bacterium]|nr:hypothetical protein [Spirochaetales bacterium]